ncbi:hypothetical protein BB050_04208 [Flavobacterium anhuiense]|uniref:Uncharacterized protein n=1 Tax=Flavobacterium anhuiense TaxID=459526 RepID=A0AAC9D5X5_9FLAO|nr:hypothetical protein BB050_04208 [Flavobacterium anhuiense]
MLAKSQSRKVLFELPPALAGGLKEKNIEKALAKLSAVWLKPLKVPFFHIQLKLDAIHLLVLKKLCVSAPDSYRDCEIKYLACFA